MLRENRKFSLTVLLKGGDMLKKKGQRTTPRFLMYNVMNIIY